MNQASPPVTVMMCAYNEARFIRESIESILAQSFTAFELLVLDDGSTDATAEMIQSFTDARIRLIRGDGHQGLAAARNRCLEEARGDYLAIIDADDVALPHRLARQVEYLDTHPKVVAVGSGMQVIDEGGIPQGKPRFYDGDPAVIRWRLLTGGALINGSAMLRTQLARQANGFGNYPYAEDYDLYARLSLEHDIGNLQEVLLLVRFNLSSVSRTMPPQEKARYFHTISQAAISRYLGREVPLEVIRLLRVMRLFSHRDELGEHHWSSAETPQDVELIPQAIDLYRDLYEQFVQTQPMTPQVQARLVKDVQQETSRLAGMLPNPGREALLPPFP